LLIATIIFSAGFLLSHSISYYKYQSINLAQERIKYELLSIDLERELLTSTCLEFNTGTITEELVNMGSVMGILEERFGKTDEKVLEQKKIYTLLELKHFQLATEYSEICDKKVNTILFFYSNDKSFESDAERKGLILSNLKKQKEGILVYSFDYDLDMNIIKLLKQKYNVTKPNTLVINEEIILESVTNINEIDLSYFN
jgi:hypothetical protein